MRFSDEITPKNIPWKTIDTRVGEAKNIPHPVNYPPGIKFFLATDKRMFNQRLYAFEDGRVYANWDQVIIVETHNSDHFEKIGGTPSIQQEITFDLNSGKFIFISNDFKKRERREYQISEKGEMILETEVITSLEEAEKSVS